MLDKALVLAAEDNLPRIAFAELTDADAPVRVKRSCKPDDVSFIERRLVFLQPYDVFMRVSWTVPDTFGPRIGLVPPNHRRPPGPAPAPRPSPAPFAPRAATSAYARRTAPASAQARTGPAMRHRGSRWRSRQVGLPPKRLAVFWPPTVWVGFL